MKKILVVAAHPDDEILGCGGTLIKEIEEGNEVYCIILGKGMASRDTYTEADKEILMVSCKSAGSLLGIKDTWIFDFPDNRYDSIPLLDLVKKIEAVKEVLKPQVVYTHFQGDLNIDHKITFKAVLTACRPTVNESVKEIYSFYTPSATEWGNNAFLPNMFVNVNKYIDKKMDILKCYFSEIKTDIHPRSIDGIRLLSSYYGTMIGVASAEPFIIIRKIVD